MRASVGPADFEPHRGSSPSGGAVSPRAAGEIRNVVILVLESVPARYVEPFGGRFPVTPELKRQRPSSALFTNVYAHCPETSHSLVSLLLSIYPPMTYKSLTAERPEVPFPSLSSELKRRGYETAFFNAADNRYQRADRFLSHRAFDRIVDYRTVPCDAPVLAASRTDWPFLDGKDDLCVADASIAWIDSVRDRPFFAVVWTMMTHFPYFAAEPVTDFGVPAGFNNYLNALRRADAALGRLLQALKERGLDRSTLVVVVGDHGEAFGEHGQFAHARYLYEENVHVPLVLIHPDRFHGEESPAIGGLIDIAPTVLDALGFPPPPEWQGRSLWSADRSGRAYFFVSGSEHLFGLREGNRKAIYDAEADRFEVYDLAADPGETVNLAKEMPEAVRVWRNRLAAWAQYQSRMTRGLLAERAGS